MKYCRYCAFCIFGDVYYCTRKNRVLTRVDRSVECDGYAESELGDVDTGKKYKPREKKEVTIDGQLNIFELMGKREDGE